MERRRESLENNSQTRPENRVLMGTKPLIHTIVDKTSCLAVIHAPTCENAAFSLHKHRLYALRYNRKRRCANAKHGILRHLRHR